MYETYFGFREKPFSLVPDPDFLYLGKHHRAALNILEYGLRGEASFALISGEVGSGKTILIRRFLRMVDQQTTVGLITNTHASLGNLLDWILLAFNLDYRGKENVELFEILTNFLKEQREQGRRTVLIIDEAQNMELEMLEELRMLSNINVDKELMFQIVLAGQPEILDKINRPELRQLAQRISANFHLSPLTLDETRDYICHRLMIAGGRREIFDNLACAAVYYFTEGLPRPINILCDAALVYGFGEERETIGLETILDVVENVQRSGLKALQALEDGFNRDELTEKITELAKTYASAEPLIEELGSLEAFKSEAAVSGPADFESDAFKQLARPDPVARPLTEDPGPEPVEQVRDVPAGIPPLINNGARDIRHAGMNDRTAAERKKLRRLFDAAAAAVVVLLVTVVLLRGLDIWSEDPVADGVEAGKVEAGAGLQAVTESESDIQADPLNGGTEVESELAETAVPASQDSDGDEEGLVQGLLSAFGWGGNGTENDNLPVEPAENSSASVTISLEASDDGDRRVESPREQGGETLRADQPEAPPAESSQPRADALDEEPGKELAKPQKPVVAETLQTAAIPASPGTASYTHWVRLGTFRRAESAPIMWNRLQRSQADLLASLSYQIAEVERGGLDTLYLLKAGPLADAEMSRSLCRDLTARGVECLASSTRSEVANLPETALSKSAVANPPKVLPTPNSAVSQNADLYKLALAHSQDGETHSKNGDYDKAIQEFNNAIRLNPGLASAHYNRGEIYFRKGDYAQAIRDFTRTIGLAPDYTFAYYSRGVANEKSGDIKRAILDFTHTVRLKPSYAPAYNDRARAFYNLGHLREALRDSELAISVAPGSPSYLATHSLILAALGRNEGAFATLEKAMAIANAEWIKKYQQAMSRDGYYRGPIDGLYGPATKSAMRACLVSGCDLADWN